MADEQSAFNMHVAFLQRLRALLDNCAETSAQLNYEEWFYTLVALRREIYDDMDEAAQTKANEFKTKLTAIVARYSAGNARATPTAIYDELDRFELFLRGAISKKGYKIKTKAKAEDSLV